MTNDERIAELEARLADATRMYELVASNRAQELVAELQAQLAEANKLLDLHRRYHGKVGCPGSEDCYICKAEQGET